MNNNTRILQFELAHGGRVRFKNGSSTPIVAWVLVEYIDDTDPEFVWQELRPLVGGEPDAGDSPSGLWDATEADDYAGVEPHECAGRPNAPAASTAEG